MNNLHKFNDIYKITKSLDKKQKGDLFELFTYYLFKFDPKLNNNLQNIWLYKDIPVHIVTKLDLPAKDKGIDLLAQIDDKYYAIQSKYRQDSNVIISWNHLATFFGLTFGINNGMACGFLVTNTFDLCSEVKKSTKIEPIYGDYYDDLPKQFFENIRNDLNNKQLIKYVPKKPFRYQILCQSLSVLHLSQNARGYIEMACGSGKTLTSYWIDKLYGTKKTVIFVPSLYLLSQFYGDWINQSYADNCKINYLLIGSDADMDEETKYKSNGLLLCTEGKQIKSFLNSFKIK